MITSITSYVHNDQLLPDMVNSSIICPSILVAVVHLDNTLMMLLTTEKPYMITSNR